MSMFHVGQKVVCVAKGDGVNGWTCRRAGGSGVKEGDTIAGPILRQVYIIDFVWTHGEKLYLGFAEFGPMMVFASQKFRPVRETSIEVFRALLNSKPSDLPAEPAEPRFPVLNWGG